MIARMTGYSLNFNMEVGSYLSDQERKQLGHLQWRMLWFVRKNANGDTSRLYTITKDSTTKRVATSLERRGLIRIDKSTNDWMIGLPQE